MVRSASQTMMFTELSAFNFDPRQNEFLFFENGRPRRTALVMIAVIVGLFLFAGCAVDPNCPPPHLRGKGAAIVTLLLMMPVAMRVAVIALAAGCLSEDTYRLISRSFDGKPDFVIGTSGVVDLNPWAPKAILWPDVREIRRFMIRYGLRDPEPVCLQFVAPRARPSSVPPWLWDLLPGTFTERSIALGAESVGLDQRGLESLVWRYGGSIAIRDRVFVGP